MGPGNTEPYNTTKKDETTILVIYIYSIEVERPPPKILNCTQEKEATIDNFPHFHNATLGLTHYST